MKCVGLIGGSAPTQPSVPVLSFSPSRTEPDIDLFSTPMLADYELSVDPAG